MRFLQWCGNVLEELWEIVCALGTSVKFWWYKRKLGLPVADWALMEAYCQHLRSAGLDYPDWRETKEIVHEAWRITVIGR